MRSNRLRRVLTLAFNPAASADRLGSRIVKALAFLGAGSLWTTQLASLSLMSKLAISLTVIALLGLWACYKLQAQLDTAGIQIIVKPWSASRVKLCFGPAHSYELHADMELRFENALDKELILKSLRMDLIRRWAWFEWRTRTIELAHWTLRGQSLVRITDLPIPAGISTQRISIKHALPEMLSPSAIGKRSSLRFTASVLGQPEYVVEAEVDWPRAIRTLDPDAMPQVLRRESDHYVISKGGMKSAAPRSPAPVS